MKTLSSDLAVLAAAVEARTAFIYRFTAAAIPNGVWCYTSLPSPLVMSGERYESVAIAFDQAQKGAGGMEQNAFTITAPVVEPFLSFCGRRLNIRIDCTISEIFFKTDGTPVIDPVISGQLTSVKRDLTSIRAEFKPLATFLTQKIPATLFSQLDQRVPYTTDFGLTSGQIAAFATEAVATDINGNLVTSTAAAAQDDGYYYNGYISYQRHIAGKLVTLKIPIINNDKATGVFTLQWEPQLLLTEGAKFTAYAGYDGSVTQSKTKFNNLLAGSGYLGFPTFSQSNWALTGMEDCANVVGECGEVGSCSESELLAVWPTRFKVKLRTFRNVGQEDGYSPMPALLRNDIALWLGYIYPQGGKITSCHGCAPRSGMYPSIGQCSQAQYMIVDGYWCPCDGVVAWFTNVAGVVKWWLRFDVYKLTGSNPLTPLPTPSNSETGQSGCVNLWLGSKVIGDSPSGRYTRVSGCAGDPSYIDVEDA